MKKMEGTEETIYGILLDVQKQIGELSRQTGEQTQKLVSIENRVIYTNGTVNEHAGKISDIEKKQENWNGRIAVISFLGAGAFTIVLAYLKKAFGL